MGKQSKEYNHAYNSGFYAGLAEAQRQNEAHEDDVAAYALAELGAIIERAEGYARLGRGSDGTVWARYKWTAGTHADHYTFGSGISVGLAIAQMCERVAEVEAGKRKPTRDTGYKRR